MSIEKAFAIQASPECIWEALIGEMAAADPGSHTVERADPPRLLSLRLAIAGVPALLTYRIAPQAGYTEVAARLEPSGLRYALFQFFTLGRFGSGFEVLLVEGLANLKRAVEGGAGAGETPPASDDAVTRP